MTTPKAYPFPIGDHVHSFTSTQLSQAAVMVAEAERVLVESKVLRMGLKLTEEEMEQARALADMARKTGAPDRFLAAMTASMTRPPFLPCSCWWCRARRWIGHLLDKPQQIGYDGCS